VPALTDAGALLFGRLARGGQDKRLLETMRAGRGRGAARQAPSTNGR
jgi:hypothetical protein